MLFAILVYTPATLAEHVKNMIAKHITPPKTLFFSIKGKIYWKYEAPQSYAQKNPSNITFSLSLQYNTQSKLFLSMSVF